MLTAGDPSASRHDLLPVERAAVVEPGGEVTLPPRIVGDLRLLRAEPFVAFTEGLHFIQLVRADAVPAALAAAERVSLHGSIEGFGIADLFSLLNMSRRSGLLLLITDRIQKSIYFRRGEIAFAESNDPEERLEQVLYRTGKLGRSGLEAADRHLRSGLDPGRVLLDLGLLDAADLSWGLRHQVEEIVYSVFRLTQGSFLLFDGDFLDSTAPQLAIDTNNVLMEAYQRVDELGLITQHIRGQGTILRPTGRKAAVKLGDRLQRVLALVDGRTPVEEIVRATGWGEFNTFKALYKLIQGGLAEVAETGPAAPPRPGDQQRAELAVLVETYNRAFLLLRDVLRAKAVEVDLGRAFEGFRRGASEATRAVFHGLQLGASRRFPPDALIDNAEHLLLLETTSLAGHEPPLQRRHTLVAQALADWTTFQSLLVRNLLPVGEARELLSYALAIIRSPKD